MNTHRVWSISEYTGSCDSFAKIGSKTSENLWT